MFNAHSISSACFSYTCGWIYQNGASIKYPPCCRSHFIVQLSLRIQLVISQHWPKKWLGAILERYNHFDSQSPGVQKKSGGKTSYRLVKKDPIVTNEQSKQLWLLLKMQELMGVSGQHRVGVIYRPWHSVASGQNDRHFIVDIPKCV